MAKDYEYNISLNADASKALNEIERLIQGAKKTADGLKKIGESTGGMTKTIAMLERMKRELQAGGSITSKFSKDFARAATNINNSALKVHLATDAQKQLTAAKREAMRTEKDLAQLGLASARTDSQKALTSKRVQDARLAEAKATKIASDAEIERQRIASRERIEASKVSLGRDKIAATTTAQNNALMFRYKQQADLNDYRAQTLAYRRTRDEARDLAQAQRALDREAANASRSLVTQRYALYDVAGTMRIVSGAILVAAAAAAKVVIDFDKAFASVARTTGVYQKTQADVERLRTELVDLSTAVPVAFADLGEIATLGGQLGIAEQDIVSFTETVAKLTATTDLTGEAAGTALGRFQALLHVPASQFDNLASSILNVGVNSVATESQIVTIATELSGIGQMAGLTAEQVVGLAGAMASVAIRPELSRGLMTRLFTAMSKAVSDGGAKLEKFAKISDVTVQQFKDAWGTENFAPILQNFFAGIEKQGKDSAAVITDIGLAASRDIPSLQKLAQATDVVSAAFADAAAGYGDTAALNEQYGIVAETISAKMVKVANTIKAIIDELGRSGLTTVFNALLGALQAVADGFLAIVRTPILGQIIALAGAFTVAMGALLGMRAAQLSARATILATTTALQSMGGVSLGTGHSVRELIRVMLGLAQGNVRVAQTAGAAAAGTAAVGTAANTSILQAVRLAHKSPVVPFFAKVNNGVTAATGALASFGRVVAGIAKAFAPLLALSVAVSAISSIVDAFKSADDRAKEFLGTIGGLSEAIAQDTEIYKETGENIRLIGSQAGYTGGELLTLADRINNTKGITDDLNESIRWGTGLLQEQTIAIGQNTLAWYASSLMDNEAFVKFYNKNKELLDFAKFSIQDFVRAMAEGNATQYVTDLANSMDDISDTEYVETMNQGGYVTTELGSTASGASSALRQLLGDMGNTDSVIGMALATGELKNELYGLIGGTEETGDELADLGSELENMINHSYNSASSLMDVGEAAGALGRSLAENGNTFDIYTANGAANMQALQKTVSAMATAAGGDSAAFASAVSSLISSLEAQGFSAVRNVAWVAQVLANISAKANAIGGRAGMSINLSQMIGNMSRAVTNNLIPSFQKAREEINKTGGAGKSAGDKGKKAAKEVAAEVRTLTDYVKDLSSIFKNAFDIRFGLEIALDKVADSWDKLGEYAEKAAEEIEKANEALRKAAIEIAGLYADRSILEYQLGVAIEYGDTLRAADIMADLQKNGESLISAQGDQEDAARDLEKGYQKLDKRLDGSTDASREQRNMVRSLVSAYQEQIEELANTGATQDELAAKTEELRNKFVSQMIQMGYNTDEVARYASAFDDFAYIIRNFPRVITIDLNKNAAERALAEFLAKIESSRPNVTTGSLTSPGGVNLAGGGITGAGDIVTSGSLRAAGGMETTGGLRASGNMTASGGFSIGGGGSIGGNLAVSAGMSIADVYSRSGLNTESIWVRYGTDSSTMNVRGGISAQSIHSRGSGRAYAKGGPVEYRASGGVMGMHPGRPRGTDTIPAWLTPNEFVMTRKAHEYYGTPFFNMLNKMQLPRFFAGGGSVSTSSSGGGNTVQLVEVMPHQIRQIADAVSSVLVLEGRVVAQTVNNMNTNDYRRARG